MPLSSVLARMEINAGIDHGILQVKILEWVVVSFSRDLPNPGMEPRSPALQVDSLPSEPLGKPKGSEFKAMTIPQV